MASPLNDNLMQQSRQFHYKNHLINYHQYGNGDKFVLAFHGFGQLGTDYESLARAMNSNYSFLSFDLFYHGRSFWDSGDTPLSKEEWKNMLIDFLDFNNIDRFSVCGFSLGGKFALATLEAFPKKIESLILIAPDGIHTNSWYSLATYPGLFKRYFKSMIVKPHRFFNLINLAKKLGVVDKGILKFAASQMNSIKKRRRVYYAWVVFKELEYDMQEIASLINSNHIPTAMYLGTHDKIITQQGMQKLLKHVDNYELQIIESGHNKLIEKLAEKISEGSIKLP